MDECPIVAIDGTESCLAEANGRLGDGVKDRLHIGWRIGDHPQDLACRGLLLEGFLRLVEEAYVLDRDHRLIREGLHQFDLGVRERPHLITSAPDCSNRDTVADDRDSQICPERRGALKY